MDREDELCTTSVMLRGGVFEMKIEKVSIVDDPYEISYSRMIQKGVISTEFYSVQPEETAREIAKRLAARVFSGVASQSDVCPVS